MKKYLVMASVVSFASLWTVQALALELDTDKKRFSYIVGMQVGQQIKGDNIDLDEAAFMAAIRDRMTGAKLQINPADIQATLTRIQKQREIDIAKLAETNQAAGQKFLAANKDKAGVKTLPNGVQYKVIKPGTGASPKASDTVEVHYRGMLIDGTEFDSSYSRGQPTSFPVNGVIKGWQEALQAMKEGAHWQIVVPSELAYGESGAGGAIGPNATLIFDVELLKIEKQ